MVLWSLKSFLSCYNLIGGDIHVVPTLDLLTRTHSITSGVELVQFIPYPWGKKKAYCVSFHYFKIKYFNANDSLLTSITAHLSEKARQ